MCYTGKCPYENYEGECTRPWFSDYPDDAHCVLMEKAQELEATGLLGDVDIDDAEAITTAFEEYVERGQEVAAREEALGELEGFGPIKAHCARCPHVATCGHVAHEGPDFETATMAKRLRSAISAVKEAT